jgi:hypothetical protein
MHAGLVIETAYCTQQTGVLTRGIALRAIHAAGVNCIGKKRCYLRPVRPRDLACNALPCSFTPATTEKIAALGPRVRVEFYMKMLFALGCGIFRRLERKPFNGSDPLT